MRKKKYYTLSSKELNYVIGILLGSGSMGIRLNKPIFRILYKQNSITSKGYIGLIKLVLKNVRDESRLIFLKGHKEQEVAAKWFLSLQNNCFSFIFDMFFRIEQREVMVKKKIKVKISNTKYRTFTIGEKEITKYKLIKIVPERIYDYINDEVLACWFMDENSYYYSDENVSGYILYSNSFTKEEVIKLQESLEVVMKLSTTIYQKSTGEFIIFVNDVFKFNNLVYKYILPEYRLKLHIKGRNINKLKKPLISYHKDIIIATLLGGTCIISHNIYNYYYLKFVIPDCESIYKDKLFIILGDIILGNCRFNKRKKIWTMKSFKDNKYIYNLYLEWYDNDKKIMPKNLMPIFNPRMIAYWFLDDGCVYRPRKWVIYVYFRNSPNFIKDDLIKLKNLFKKLYDIDSVIYDHELENGHIHSFIIIDIRSIKKFIKLIEEYII